MCKQEKLQPNLTKKFPQYVNFKSNKCQMSELNVVFGQAKHKLIVPGICTFYMYNGDYDIIKCLMNKYQLTHGKHISVH